jgi:hypothetical protein
VSSETDNFFKKCASACADSWQVVHAEIIAQRMQTAEVVVTLPRSEGREPLFEDAVRMRASRSHSSIIELVCPGLCIRVFAKQRFFVDYGESNFSKARKLFA